MPPRTLAPTANLRRYLPTRLHARVALATQERRAPTLARAANFLSQSLTFLSLMITPCRPLHTCLSNSLASLGHPCLALGNFPPFSRTGQQSERRWRAAAHGNLPPQAGQYLIRRLNSLLPRPRRPGNRTCPKPKCEWRTDYLHRPPARYAGHSDHKLPDIEAHLPKNAPGGTPASEDPLWNIRQRGVFPRPPAK